VDIRSILERINDYLEEVKKGWLIILLCSAFFGSILFVNSLLKPTFYQAKTTFHPETGNQEGERMSPINLLFGGQSGGGSNQFMIGILKSRNLSEEVTSDSVMWKGEKRLLAEIILESLPQYSSIPSYIQYLTDGEASEMDKKRKIIRSASYIRSSQSLQNTEEGFIQLLISAYDREIAQIISETYIEQLSIYYSKRKTEKASRNVDFFSYRADSVKKELDKVNRRIANYSDRSQYKIYSRNKIIPVDLESQQAILSQIYSSLVISREQALAQLQENIPVIQVLDPPKPPFKVVSSKKIIYLAVGLAFGFFLGVLLVSWKLLRNDLTYLIRTSLKLDEVEEKDKVEEPPLSSA